ncbi:MAG TPA: PilZ domain-containing protein [Methylomirabilota bacterium]|nr:PilZ domain-containing protein [Methylomirabilota bacterium]
MPERPPSSARRYQRVRLGKRISVAWQDASRSELGHVKALGLGGLFISTRNPPPVGTILKLVFDVPHGEVRARGIVRNIEPGLGMGIEFTGMGYEDRGRLSRLLKDLSK